MGVVAPNKQTLTLQQNKLRAQKQVIKPKPGPPAVALTNSDIKNAVKGWFDNQLKLWMDRVSATQDAIHQADMAYQDIMSRKATPPILDALLEKLVIGFAMAVMPELSGAALVFKQVINESELRKKAAEKVAEMTKEAYKEIKKSLDEYKAEEDAANSKHLAVMFFQGLYSRVGALRDRATIVNVKLTHYIDVMISSKDPKLQPKLDDVLGVWYDAGLQTDESVRIDSLQLSLLFLYDLMRLYCKQNVTLKAEAHIVNYSWELDGLDSSRREAMFGYFKEIRWRDPQRPPVLSWDTLIDNWGYRRE